jgi:hypothetical protein
MGHPIRALNRWTRSFQVELKEPGQNIVIADFSASRRRGDGTNIRETVSAGGLGDAFFEGVGVAFLIDFGWSGLPQNFAETV